MRSISVMNVRLRSITVWNVSKLELFTRQSCLGICASYTYSWLHVILTCALLLIEISYSDQETQSDGWKTKDISDQTEICYALNQLRGNPKVPFVLGVTQFEKPIADTHHHRPIPEMQDSGH
jgi:hypothetical protein